MSRSPQSTSSSSPPSSSSSAPPLPGRAADRQPLSVERITDAALALIDRDGLDAFSMRKLGAELGYEAMAIYKHIPDKESVIDHVVVAVFDEMTVPDAALQWPDRLRHSASELRRAALAHPHLLARLATDPPTALPVQQRVDAILGALREATGDDAAAVRWFWMFVSYTTGALLAETAPAREASPLVADDRLPVECPVLAALGPQLALCDFGSEYDRGVDMIIDMVGRAGPS